MYGVLRTNIKSLPPSFMHTYTWEKNAKKLLTLNIFDAAQRTCRNTSDAKGTDTKPFVTVPSAERGDDARHHNNFVLAIEIGKGCFFAFAFHAISRRR